MTEAIKPEESCSKKLLLKACGLEKSFPGVKAIGHADLELSKEEIHSLVGENGAGKSTLIKILAGAHHQDAGHLLVDGSSAPTLSPTLTRKLGIAVIYQEFNLIQALSIRENLFLGHEKTRWGILSAKAEALKASEVLTKLGLDINPETPVSALDVATKQLVEIARALLFESRLLILDEPTAALTPREVEKLFYLLRDLKKQGLAILFISHRLDEIYSISDKITVMRDGETVGTWPVDQLSRNELVEKMVGRKVGREYPKKPVASGEVVLEVEHLSGGRVEDISFKIKAGEILGFAGLIGAGRTDVARMIFGADRNQNGIVRIDGQEVQIRSPRDAIYHGIGFLTEDRKEQGLVLGLPSLENFSLSNLKNWSKKGWIKLDQEVSLFKHYVESLKIKLAGGWQPAGTLSGGNQQKLLVARWLAMDSKLLIFDEPTRGIDVGAKVEMYELMNELAASGKTIMMISSELPEVLGMSDRVIVMREGRITGEIKNPGDVTQADVMALAVGETEEDAGISEKK